MHISEKGLKLIKEFEGCYLKAYRDPVGIWTIGFGVTNADKSVTGTTIKEGLRISQATADKWLEESIRRLYEPKVMKYNDKYHWNQNQFDALVSFCYNIGSIDQLTKNGTRSVQMIADKILEYDGAKGRKLAGLTRRRKAEHDLFITKPDKAPQKAVQKRTGYTGKFPCLPPRGYYKWGDGYLQLRGYNTQIKRVQKLCTWITGVKLTIDGDYGNRTVEAVKKAQGILKVKRDGHFGPDTLAKARLYKK